MVISQVDTRQHNLLEARSFLALHVLYDRSNVSAARTTTYIRDNAIGTTIIATILHFHLHASTRGQPGAARVCNGRFLDSKWRQVRWIVSLWLFVCCPTNQKQSITANMLSIKRQHRQRWALWKELIGCNDLF